nr:unnamed protein product [Digitaria exilis]
MVATTATEESNNAVAQQESSIENVFCMEGGQGPSSYMNNSQMQSRATQLVLHVLKETLDNMIQLPSLLENKLLTVADLGCSCG